MLELIERNNRIKPACRDKRQEFLLRLKRIYREYPGAIVVRTERHHDSQIGPRAFCAAHGIVPLAAHCEDGVTETAFSFSVYEAYIRHLARIASQNADGWMHLPTAFWEDPDRFGGFCEMTISLAA